MAIDITSVFDSRNAIDQLVQQYMALESRPRDMLVERKNNLEQRKSVLTDLDSKLSALKTQVDRLTDTLTNYFAAKTATSSNSDYFTVSADYSAQLGNHSLTVTRTASSDTRVSQQYTDSASDFTGFTTDQTFSIEVAHPTDTNPNNRVSISVTVSASSFSQTNDLVLQDIANAINSAMSDAVTADTIADDEVVRATVVNEESGVSRLVLRSNNSGYTYRMNFTDSADGLLSTLQVSAATQATGTSGGYITYVGTGPTDSNLNAQFTLDGLTFYRDSNQVTDALDGVTINLLDTFSTNETLTVSADTDAVRQEVNNFISAYNDVLKFLKKNAQINPDTKERGILSDDVVYKDLYTKLRSITTSVVSGVTNSDYDRLYDMGIEADDDGYLSISDTDKFDSALKANSVYVSDIFRASDGIATQIKNYIDDFVAVGGTIDSSKENIDTTLIDLEDRISLWDETLAKREAQLRQEFAKIQENLAMLNQQQSFWNYFMGR